jgi:hypothetical protein
MARQTYATLGDPVRAFEALRPYVDQLRVMQRQCKPFGRDYHAIAIAIEGLETAAYHFTRRPRFYQAEPGG